ncbi:MAG: hypothetical protein KC483_10195 [Nitrosarchaeum sp.]|nr:hypothetical protein [Nitrosarchaeum sp.]
MTIKITGSLIKEAFVSNLFQEIQKAMFKAASDATLDIHNRTLAGKDKNNQTFKEYAEVTKAQKIAEHKQSDPPNLKQTGLMLGGIQVGRPKQSVRRVTIDIFITGDQADKARGHQFGIGRLPKREFFGLTTKEKETFRSTLEKLIDLKKANS